MALFRTLKFILDHPLTADRKLSTLIRYGKWQIFFRLVPYPVLYPYVDGTRIIAYKGLTGAVFNIYTGLHEFEDMAFLLHMLRPSDSFADIGANIGSYTILSAGVVGCKTTSIEPVPATFELMQQNIAINELALLTTAHNVGLGSEKGILKFTNTLDTINHVAAEGDHSFIEVKVETLDNLVAETPDLIKLDVEGFEDAVLRGGKQILQDQKLKAIIIELNGMGKRYGYHDEDIHCRLTELGFYPFAYRPFQRQLIAMDGFGTHNTIYIRDVEEVKQRLISAKKIKVLGKDI